MKKGIIWDLDGTLWDSSAQVCRAWNDTMVNEGIDRRFTCADVKSYCGRTLEQIGPLAFPTREDGVRLVYACCDLENVYLEREGGLLYPHEREVLTALKQKYHLSVVSNCGEGYIEAYLTGNRMWDLFDDRENAVHTGLSKAQNIRLVMERNQLTHALYIGDTQGDKAAADAAGVPFVFASYGFGSVPDAKWSIALLPELPALAEEILS